MIWPYFVTDHFLRKKKQKQKKQEMVSHAIIQGYSLGVLSFFFFSKAGVIQ